MKLFGKKSAEDDTHYEGNALLRMLSYVKPYWKQLVLCLALVLCITLLELWKPILIGDAIDRYITQETAPQEELLTEGETAQETVAANRTLRFTGILKSAGVYLLVLVLLFFCNRYQILLLQHMGQSIIYDIRLQTFRHIESLSMRTFDTTPVGKIVTRVTNDAESVNDLYANVIVNLFKNLMKVLGLAVMMLAIDVRMALWSFVTLPFVIVLTFVFRKMARRAYQATSTRRTHLNTFLSEHISGMKVIQVFRREKQKHAEFCEKSEDLYQASWKEMMVFAIFRPLIYILSVAALAIVLGAGAGGVIGGTVTLGTLYIFVQYIQSFFNPIENLAEQLSTLESAIASAEKIFTLLDTKPIVRGPEEPKELTALRGRIEFDHVWFAYKDEEWVLKDVSFTIEPGQRAAFVGATGAGKSSILNLIGRYYDVQKGRILVDGVDVRELDREQLRRAIGQVQQDVFIFTGDIRSNIRLRDEDITDEEVEAAAREVNAAKAIERLPEGYESRVSERGATLSAGQRQLLSFARTLAHDPKILILDEATAHIDTETERWIQEAMDRLMSGRTTIMVAHRLSTIQHADIIMVMHKGRLCEQGTHQQLLEQHGIYHKLYQLQLHDDPA